MSKIEEILVKAKELADLIDSLPFVDKVEAINKTRMVIHDISPFKHEPVDCVVWIPNENVVANKYNPNKVAPPQMKLLRLSVQKDGYTMPIVSMKKSDSVYEIIDGFHRNRVGKEYKEIRDRVHGHLPLSLINKDRYDEKDRKAATWRHNEARGKHGIDPITTIIQTVIEQGWNDDMVCREFGIGADEVLRFKQNTGLPELFKDRSYSKAWE